MVVGVLQVEHAPFARFRVAQRPKDLPKMAVAEGSEDGYRRLKQRGRDENLDLRAPDALVGHLTFSQVVGDAVVRRHGGVQTGVAVYLLDYYVTHL